MKGRDFLLSVDVDRRAVKRGVAYVEERLRAKQMRIIVFLALAALPILEIALLIKLGQWIGFWPTVLYVLGSAALGGFVLNRQGLKVMNRVMASIADGKPPVGPVVDGAFMMGAGGLLIVPGLITDAIGLLLLIPPIRHAVAAWSVRRFLRSAVVVQTQTTFRDKARADQNQQWPGQDWPGKDRASGSGHGPSDGPVIDGEFERLDERTIDPRKSGSHRSSANGATPPGDRPQ